MPAADLNAITAVLTETKGATAPDRQAANDARRAARDGRAAARGTPPAKGEAVADLERTPPKPGTDEDNVDVLDEIDRLTNGDDEAQGDDTAAAGDAELPKSLKALAEKLGVDPAELYKLEIPLGNDESMTLGQIKDLAKGANDLDVARAQFDEAVETQRVAARKEREDVEQLVALLPPQALTPQMIAKAREAGEAYKAKQGALLAELVPEWKDGATYTADRAEILAHVEKAGWSKDDLDAVYDARLLAYFRRQAKREQRMNAILERLQAAPSGGRGFKANASAKARADSARAQTVARSGTRAQQVSEIDKILKG